MEISLIFNRKKRLVRGEGIIELQLYISRTNRPIKSTGIKIEPQFWNESKELVKKSHPNHDFLNDQLSELKTRMERKVLNQKLNDELIDLAEPKQKNIDFYEFFEKDVMSVSNADLTKGTQLIYKRTLKYMKEFKRSVTIDKIDLSFVERFNKFLIEKKNLHLNSRASLLRKLKKAINLAINHDHITPAKNPFLGFQIKEIEPEKKSLTLAELRKIEHLDMSLRPELIKTRKMFLFCCYTALRFGDLVQLTVDNFEELESGKIRLSYNPNKTKRINNKVVKWIISDFWNGAAHKIVELELLEWSKLPNETRPIFQYTNEFYNRQLKELQRFAGIKTILTSHLARHTCITLLVNDFELDITKAQLIAGHSKIEMTQRYLRITERDLAESASRVNWDK